MTRNAERNAMISALFESGLTYSQIAKRLNISRGAVSGHLFRQRHTSDHWTQNYPKHFRALVLKSAETKGVKKAANDWGVSPASVFRWQKAVGA